MDVADGRGGEPRVTTRAGARKDGRRARRADMVLGTTGNVERRYAVREIVGKRAREEGETGG